MPAIDALQRDEARAPRDPDRRQHAVELIDQQHHVGGLGRGRRAPGAHGHADIGRRQRRRVVDAVADHHHRAVLALRQHHQDLLVGRELRAHRVDGQAGGDGFARPRGGRRSPARCARCRARAARAAAACGAGAQRVGRGSAAPASLPSTATATATAPGGRSRAERREAADRPSLPAMKCSAADHDRAAVDPAVDALARRLHHLGGTASARPLPRASATMVWAMMCLEAWSSEAASRSSSSGAKPVGDADRHELGLAVGQRAGLVDDQRAHPRQRLDRLAALDQDAELGRARQPGRRWRPAPPGSADRASPPPAPPPPGPDRR